MKENLSASLKAQAVNTLKLPKDLVYAEAVVTLTGTRELVMENYKGIREYTRDHVWVQTYRGKILIHGKNLTVDSYTKEELKVSGQILDVVCEELKTSVQEA